jgi:hypothetical protein
MRIGDLRHVSKIEMGAVLLYNVYRMFGTLADAMGKVSLEYGSQKQSKTTS